LNPRRRRAEPLERDVAIVLAKEAEEPLVVIRRHVEQLYQQPVLPFVSRVRFHDGGDRPRQIAAMNIG
jgi:hypothetical protein